MLDKIDIPHYEAIVHGARLYVALIKCTYVSRLK